MAKTTTNGQTPPIEQVAPKHPTSNPQAGDNSPHIADEENNLPDLNNPSLFINRELSQIAFNKRVLEESYNSDHPLLERVKFIGICASNMDEFFMVRVSGLRQQFMLGVTDRSIDGLLPREQLAEIHRRATQLAERQMKSWQTLQQQLADEGIRIYNHHELKSRRRKKLSAYFEHEIFPVLTPLAFDPGHPFPHISNLSLNLAVLVRDPDSGVTHFARVKVPSTIPRLIPVKRFDPDDLRQPTDQRFVWVEQIIAANLERLFAGMEIVASYPFRVTRSTDIELQEEEADDLLLTIEENLRKRHFGSVVRLEIDESMPENVLTVLLDNFQVSNNDVFRVDGPLDLSALLNLHKLEFPTLKDAYLHPVLPPPLRNYESIFSAMRRQEVLLHRPYDSFAPVISMLEEAAVDPDVLAIKMTLYRIGPNSPVVATLTRARENGKQVAVLVELKARFDEESNIEWARALERAGVHVVYGLIGLKTHCKLTLILRRERDGIRRYMHMSTGNYNATTARVYTDLDFLTTDEDLGADASDIFNYLTGISKQSAYRKMLVAPSNLRQNLLNFIEREIEHGSNGHIIIKANSIADKEIIQTLYRASQAGVKVDLMIRGICCLRPGIPHVSENIQVKSIVGRFLEHHRIFYFHNNGKPDLYVGSADLMPRNIDRRVEVVFPIENKTLRSEIVENILQVYWRDSKKGHWLQADGNYRESLTDLQEDEEAFDSQAWFLNGRTTYQQGSSQPNVKPLSSI